MTTSEIFLLAFKSVPAYDTQGRVVNELNHFAGQIICSASERVRRGTSRYNGSVARYYEYLKSERDFVRAFTENKYGELA